MAREGGQVVSALQQDPQTGHRPLFEVATAALSDHLSSVVSRFTSVKRQEHHFDVATISHNFIFRLRRTNLET